MNDTGFEVRHEENLREHYAMTLARWCANLDEHWDEAVAEVGEGTARVWRLYMAGSRVGFERNVRPAAPDPGREARRRGTVGHAAAPGLGGAAPGVRGRLAPGGGPAADRRADGLRGALAGGLRRAWAGVSGRAGGSCRPR